MAADAPTLMQYLQARFDGLEDKLDEHCRQADRLLADHDKRIRALEAVHTCPAVVDHEKRLRSLEKQTGWQWVAQFAGGVAAAIGIKTGFGG